MKKLLTLDHCFPSKRPYYVLAKKPIIKIALFSFFIFCCTVGMAQQPYYPAEVKSPENILNVNGMWYYTSNHFDSCRSTTPYEPYDCVTFVKGFNLWKSNGTSSGTHKIRSFSFSADIEEGGPDEIPDDAFIPFNNSLVYIGARDPYSFTIEKIDNNSTTYVGLKYFSHNRSAYNFDYQFTQVGNLLYFVSNDDGFYGSGNNGTELWKTDGTPQGTVMVKDIGPGSLGSNPYGLKKDTSNKILYFTANDGSGYKLWQSDGTASGTVPVGCSGTGSILREKWLNIAGNSVGAIPVNTAPSSSSQLTSFETASNQGDNYGERIRGYLCVPTTGSFTFYIAGDDQCELWLSTDEDPAKKTRIASVSAYTGVKVWNKYPEQKSFAVDLIAGQKYYIEALHKEATGGDNLAVGWQTPTQSTISVIPGSVLSPYIVQPPQPTGKITREFWANVTGYQISNIPLQTAPTTTDQITIFERVTNQGDNYGQRFRGYLHPQVSGNYRFFVAGDDKVELWLSTDEAPAKKAKIASLTAPTSLRQWNKYASQQSIAIALVAGRKYYIEALHKENTGNDHISVGWQLPNQTTIAVIAGTYLSPFLASPTTRIARIGVEESLESKLSLYPNPFESKLSLSVEQAGTHYLSVVDNLGRVVYQSTTQGTQTELNLAHLKAGVYVVKVSAQDGKTQVIRVVKK